MDKKNEYLTRLNIALELREINDFSTALDQLKKAKELSYTDATVYLLLGMTYEAMGDILNAEKYYLETLVIDNEYPEAKFALSMFLLKNQRIEEAAVILKSEVGEWVGSEPFAFINYSFILVSNGEINDAIEMLLLVHELFPDYLMVTDELTQLLISEERYKDASDVLERGLLLKDEEDDDVLNQMAVDCWIRLNNCYQKLGLNNKALDALERGLQEFPNNLELMVCKNNG